ncbi:hypothetical protein CAEBREN_18784 [Caenorhabditis brenneri]|uniref:ubiquitinyl hydrolase 1 n=1 Tax=Caenorhabditis brenneri TaxID=135651 RepID=G0N276_CAEBE|nr:hypothetical protein CAEBREN_18784 [Caenorhabditis brenneri]
MTILPVKKKREKDQSQQKSSSSSAAVSSSSDSNRPQQQPGGASSSSSGSGGPAPKRSRVEEPVRWVLSSVGVPIPAPVNVSPPQRVSSSSGGSGGENNSPPTTSSSALVKPKGNGDCNSGDEYDDADDRDDAREADFAQRMERRGFVIKEMEGDGACMFRAIAEQIYGDQEMHGQIRELCMNYMTTNKDHFEGFITEDYDNYIMRKREENVHGNHVELQAISEMFARPVELAAPIDGAGPSNNADQMQQNPPLRLSYHRNVHYNAILAPNEPTIGVGLGLPGLVPGAADKDLMSKAMAKSELEHIEETMLQDKIGLTDYQRTEADIEDQITRESLISYLNSLGKSSSEAAGPSTSSGETSTSSSAVPRYDFGGFGGGESSSAGGATSSSGGGASSTGTGLYEELLAAQSLDWDAYTDDVAIAEALLVSQQDYLSQMPGSSSEGAPGPSSSGSGSK